MERVGLHLIRTLDDGSVYHLFYDLGSQPDNLDFRFPNSCWDKVVEKVDILDIMFPAVDGGYEWLVSCDRVPDYGGGVA